MCQCYEYTLSVSWLFIESEHPFNGVGLDSVCVCVCVHACVTTHGGVFVPVVCAFVCVYISMYASNACGRDANCVCV